jgi:multiple sugar transport system permease protein
MKSSKTNTVIMLIPWIVIFFIFWLYPLLFTGYLSLTKYNSLTNVSEYIGLKNYIRMFNDAIFWKALKNTMFFTLGTVPFSTALAIFMASLLNSKVVKYKDFFRASFFLPSVTSLVVISLIFTNLYAKDGYVNFILSSLNLPFPVRGWLLNKNTSLIAIMIMDIWSSFGYYMVIFLAAMQALPKSMYDSAKIVGASHFYTLRRITIPMLKPTLVFVLVINVIKSFQIFIEIYIMTKGGPLHSTTTLVYMVFNNAFEKTNAMGYAAAISYFLFFILLLFSLIQIKLLNSNK